MKKENERTVTEILRKAAVMKVHMLVFFAFTSPVLKYSRSSLTSKICMSRCVKYFVSVLSFDGRVVSLGVPCLWCTDCWWCISLRNRDALHKMNNCMEILVIFLSFVMYMNLFVLFTEISSMSIFHVKYHNFQTTEPSQYKPHPQTLKEKATFFMSNNYIYTGKSQ